MKSKAWFQKGLCFSLTVCLLTGCGGEYLEEAGREGVVSGSAVSGAAVEQRTDKTVSGHRFANTTNFYMEIPSEDEVNVDKKLGLLQYKLDGTKMQTLRIKDFDGLISVEEEGVIYSRWSGKDEYKICRIPLVKGEDGDQKLDLEKEEVIYTTKQEIADSMAERYVYIDDQDIVYISAREKGENSPEMTLEVVRYDREKKKEIPLKEQLECSADYDNALIMAGSYNRKLIFSNEEKGLYCLDLDTEELDLIRKGKDIFCPDDIRDEAHTVSGRNLIYKVGEWREEAGNNHCVQTLYRYDLEEKKEDVLVGEPEVQAAVLKQGLVQGGEDTIQNIELTDYFVQGDRLYLQYQLNEDNGQEMRARYVILYKSISQNSELVCENMLTESLMKNSDSRRGRAEWYDEADKKRKKRFYEQNVGRCLKMVNGKAILFFLNVDEEKFGFGCYDLDSGKLKEISSHAAEWYEAYYDERNPYWFISMEEVWECSYEGLCSTVRDEFMSWTPNARMEVDWE